MTEAKTATLAKAAKELGWKRVLIIDGAEINENFARAARNIDTHRCAAVDRRERVRHPEA